MRWIPVYAGISRIVFLFATCGPRMRDNPAGRIIALMIRRRGLGGRICHPSWTRPEIPPRNVRRTGKSEPSTSRIISYFSAAVCLT